jgi:hypothetical protein
VLSGPYRAGPWPGLTVRGAAVLLVLAAVLAIAQLVTNDGLPMAVLSIVPLALATRLVRMPGAASAVCGAYLLPRSLASLLDPRLELPPLLLIPTMLFDLAVWLRPHDLTVLWPRRKTLWRRRVRVIRALSAWRGAFAGAVFGSTLVAVGASAQVPVMVAASLGCALVSAVLLARDVQQRDRQKRPQHHSQQ